MQAYSERSYTGDFYDLFKIFGFKTPSNQLRGIGLVEKLPTMFGPPISRVAFDAAIGLLKTWGMIEPIEGEPIFIENSALNGFIDQFLTRSCRYRTCGIDCNHCDDYAKRAIRIDPVYKEKCLSFYAALSAELYSGSMLRRWSSSYQQCRRVH